MKPIEAIFERGRLKPLHPLRLAEHQHVWLAILMEEPSAKQLTELGEKSPSFRFLAEPQEDLYSPQDAEPV